MDINTEFADISYEKILTRNESRGYVRSLVIDSVKRGTYGCLARQNVTLDIDGRRKKASLEILKQVGITAEINDNSQVEFDPTEPSNRESIVTMCKQYCESRGLNRIAIGEFRMGNNLNNILKVKRFLSYLIGDTADCNFYIDEWNIRYINHDQLMYVLSHEDEHYIFNKGRADLIWMCNKQVFDTLIRTLQQLEIGYMVKDRDNITEFLTSKGIKYAKQVVDMLAGLTSGTPIPIDDGEIVAEEDEIDEDCDCPNCTEARSQRTGSYTIRRTNPFDQLFGNSRGNSDIGFDMFDENRMKDLSRSLYQQYQEAKSKMTVMHSVMKSLKSAGDINKLSEEFKIQCAKELDEQYKRFRVVETW